MVVGALTAGLALLALTAMHALPMSAAHSDPAAAEAPAGAAVMAGMHDDHVAGMAMPADVHALDVGAATGTTGTTGTANSTGGVPLHQHSLLHLCVAVLVIGLSLALAAGVRRRPLTNSALTRIVPMRALLTRDTGPPSLAGLCLLRC